jgi:acetyl/propionyl-CoA carboxylase alpha subunit
MSVQRINAVLIANRGEIASRVIRTARRMGMRTVAVASDADLDLSFAAEADEVIALGGLSAAESYLDIDKIIAAAVAADVDAVHPGYGFLAESPAFAQACLGAGLVFVGPSPDSMLQMGHKTLAKDVAVQAGVPVLAGATIDDRLADDAAALEAQATELGFPLLVKASAGGGGRGMRLVTQLDDLKVAVEQASREAEASFGDASLFLERYLSTARHIEVQVVADCNGTVLSLGDRDCSLQRRHQKVIEEAPAPGLSPELRSEMAQSAIRLARGISYEGVGTVEYLVSGNDFFFLEMNTRLQVEHPVTEAVTGLDLVELQFLVAMGDSLPLSQDDVRLSGHAIEARLCAEDPRADYLPSSGPVAVVDWPRSANVRIEQTYFAGDEISSFYDSLVAKVIVHADSRVQARSQLSQHLKGLRFHGPSVNRDLLVTLLDSSIFDAGGPTTHSLEDSPELTRQQQGPGEPELIAVFCLALGVQPQRSPNLPAAPVRSRVRFGADSWHRVRGRYVSDNELQCEWADRSSTVRVLQVCNSGCRLQVAGKILSYEFRWDGDILWVNTHSGQHNVYRGEWLHGPGGTTAKSEPLAPVQGTVLEVAAKEGDKVVEGQILVTLEAMKMEHVVRATRTGTITAVLVEPGTHVAAGSLLATIGE